MPFEKVSNTLQNLESALAGVIEAKVTTDHSPECFLSVLQVLFIMSLFSPGFKYYTLLRVFCQIIS